MLPHILFSFPVSVPDLALHLDDTAVPPVTEWLDDIFDEPATISFRDRPGYAKTRLMVAGDGPSLSDRIAIVAETPAPAGPQRKLKLVVDQYDRYLTDISRLSVDVRLCLKHALGIFSDPDDVELYYNPEERPATIPSKEGACFVNAEGQLYRIHDGTPELMASLGADKTWRDHTAAYAMMKVLEKDVMEEVHKPMEACGEECSYIEVWNAIQRKEVALRNFQDGVSRLKADDANITALNMCLDYLNYIDKKLEFDGDPSVRTMVSSMRQARRMDEVERLLLRTRGDTDIRALDPVERTRQIGYVRSDLEFIDKTLSSMLSIFPRQLIGYYNSPEHAGPSHIMQALMSAALGRVNRRRDRLQRRLTEIVEWEESTRTDREANDLMEEHWRRWLWHETGRSPTVDAIKLAIQKEEDLLKLLESPQVDVTLLLLRSDINILISRMKEQLRFLEQPRAPEDKDPFLLALIPPTHVAEVRADVADATEVLQQMGPNLDRVQQEVDRMAREEQIIVSNVQLINQRERPAGLVYNVFPSAIPERFRYTGLRAMWMTMAQFAIFVDLRTEYLYSSMLSSCMHCMSTTPDLARLKQTVQVLQSGLEQSRAAGSKRLEFLLTSRLAWLATIYDLRFQEPNPRPVAMLTQYYVTWKGWRIFHDDDTKQPDVIAGRALPVFGNWRWEEHEDEVRNAVADVRRMVIDVEVVTAACAKAVKEYQLNYAVRLIAFARFLAVRCTERSQFILQTISHCSP
jgi:hypothetical protein